MMQDTYNIVEYGAVGDGVRLNTHAIQSAVDACSAAGGGVVLVPNGRFVTGTIFLRSDITLRLANSATIVGSTDPDDYAAGIARCGFVNEPLIDKCLIYAERATNVEICGRGTIDGRGGGFPLSRDDGRPAERPMLVRFHQCERVLVRDVHLRDAGAWCLHFRECFDVRVTGIDIDNRVNANNDGIDLMSTERARISDCSIVCEDDAICFQNLSDERSVQDVVITNCVLSTRWAAIRSGGDHGAVRNVTVSNCVIRDTYGCGIKLQVSGNGVLENVAFSNIVMENVSAPIALRFGAYQYNNESRDDSKPWGVMRNLTFSNIQASVASEALIRRAVADRWPCENEWRQCCSICGIPDHPVERVTFSNVRFVFPGEGTKDDSSNLNPPEMADVYPEYFMWGILPAYALYARHASGLTLDNVRFELQDDDHRPTIVADDVDGLDIRSLRADLGPEADCLIRSRAVRALCVTDTAAPDGRAMVCEF